MTRYTLINYIRLMCRAEKSQNRHLKTQNISNMLTYSFNYFYNVIFLHHNDNDSS